MDYSSQPREATAGSGEVLRLVVVAAREIYPGYSLGDLRKRLSFICRGLRYRKLLRQFCTRLAGLEYVRHVSARRDLIGVIDWPYLNNSWDVATRLDRIATHYELLAAPASKLLVVTRDNPLRLMDLSHIAPRCEIIIDGAHWFKREGELVLNLFQDDL